MMIKIVRRSLKYILVLLILLITNYIVITLQSCKQDFTTSPDTESQFPQDIQNIFNVSHTGNNITCTTPSCHASENSGTSGLDLVNWQNAMNGSNNGTVVIPYNGFWSHMISVVNSDTNFAPVITIPLPEYHKLSSQNVTTIMNWINSGAPDADGNIAFTNVPINEKGFITNQAADLVAVIKPNTRQVIRLIPVGESPSLDAPHYISLSPDKSFYYVSLIQTGFVEKYDAATNIKVGNMQAGISPAHIEISPDGMSGYVTNFSLGATSTRKFSTNNMTVTDIFSDQRMTGAHGMALSTDGNTLYVASEIGEHLFKISTSNFYASDSTFISKSIDPSVPPGGGGTGNFKPYQVVLSRNGNLLFVSCRGSNEVRVYNTSDLTQDTAIFLGANSYPLLMKLTNDGNHLFVCNRNNNTVSVINAQSQTLQTTITGVGIQPHGVDFTADGQYAIIACETQSGFDGHHPQIGSTKIGVSRVIRVSTFTLLTDKLEMGSFPAGITIVK